jgi:TrpR-related protein YerC/YecD
MLYLSKVMGYYMNNWDNKKTKDLINVILALKSEKEAKMFFRDLLTENELTEFGNRWCAARMLSENKTYPEIQARTNLSSRTIARISRWLNKGRGGYKLMIKKLSNHHAILSRPRKS